MKPEDRQLLIRDLCARLPYGVKVQVYDNKYAPATLTAIDVKKQECIFNFNVPVENCLPYLRPLSSMTSEEKQELVEKIVGKKMSSKFKVNKKSIDSTDAKIQSSAEMSYSWINFSICTTTTYIKWMLKNHFDIYDFIKKGLALEAPKDMYKKE